MMKQFLRKYAGVAVLLLGFSLGLTCQHSLPKWGHQRRVYVDMVADLFHAGHVEFLKKARTYGDILVVGIHSDEECVAYKRKPICTMNERVQAVAACRYVDEVVASAPLHVTEDWIKEHKIDVIIHGDDISPERAQEFYGPAIKQGIFQTVSYTQGISSTDLIKRVKASR